MPSSAERPVALIFDLDGTLVDTVEARIKSWLQVFEEERIPADRELVAPLIGSDGRRLARHVARQAGMDLGDERTEAIDRRAGEIYSGLNTDPRPLPGVSELLTELDRTGISWAIATSSRREQVAASIDALELARAPLIVDGTHVAHAKPAPDLLLLAARQLGVAPGAAWYVGDSAWDMRAAVAAGMRAVAVTTGSADGDELRAAGAETVIDSLVGVLALLAAAGGS